MISLMCFGSRFLIPMVGRGEASSYGAHFAFVIVISGEINLRTILFSNLVICRGSGSGDMLLRILYLGRSFKLLLLKPSVES